jgi:hypothetical protein
MAKRAKAAQTGSRPGVPEGSAASGTPNSNQLRNKLPSGKTALEATADLVAEGIAGNTIAMHTWSKGIFGEIDVTALHSSMLEAAETIKRHDFGAAEALLISQAASLNALFVNLIQRAFHNQYVDQFERNLRLALKAQGQCRATIETLALVKNPPVFARQANIAHGPQQVNNTLNQVSSTRAESPESGQNKLLEAHGERVDEPAACPSGTSGHALAAVAALDRPTHR